MGWYVFLSTILIHVMSNDEKLIVARVLLARYNDSCRSDPRRSDVVHGRTRSDSRRSARMGSRKVSSFFEFLHSPESRNWTLTELSLNPRQQHLYCRRLHHFRIVLALVWIPSSTSTRHRNRSRSVSFLLSFSLPRAERCLKRSTTDDTARLQYDN